MELEKILISIQNHRNLFISGPGGVGKSYLIKQIKALLTGITNTHIVAPTGVAAINAGGTTIHRFAGIGLGQGTVESLIRRVKNSRKAKKRWLSVGLLIIDEVSMLGATLMDNLDAIAQNIRRNNEPFGGIKVVLVGDMLQLPPVKDEFPFKSQVWDQLNLETFVLSHPYRFTDIDYFNILQRIRIGQPTLDDISVLQSRVLGTKGGPKKIPNINGIIPTQLYSRRKNVAEENDRMLKQLPGDTFKYRAIDQCTYKDKSLSTIDYESILDQIAPDELVLKKGAQVMLTYNLEGDEDSCLTLVNGTRGVVIECTENNVTVRFTNGREIIVDPIARTTEEDDTKITRTQLPLILAWALTIHKCQACTLEMCVGDLGPSIFEDGQAYVLLSRVRSLQGLYLLNFTSNSLKANKEALQFIGESQFIEAFK